MPRKLNINDFRAVRWILKDSDFALVQGPEPPPSDLIEKEVWDGITTLPDDVAIRTSNHEGGVLKTLYNSWGFWIESLPTTYTKTNRLYMPMCDAAYDFDSAIFNLLHGFYRQSIDSLRSALELIAIGASYQLVNDDKEFNQWRSGQLEISFRNACDKIMKNTRVDALEKHLLETLKDNMFRQKSGKDPGGWVRRLYKELCNYVHSRPGFTNGDMWNSNGPIYDKNAVEISALFYIETMITCYFLVKLARPDFILSSNASDLFDVYNTSTTLIKNIYSYIFT